MDQAVEVVAFVRIIQGWYGGRRLRHLRDRFFFRAGRNLLAERGHLDNLRSELHMGQPKPAADNPAVSEEALHLIGVRRCADVEILWGALEQQIAHAAAHQIRHMIELPQAVKNLQRVGVDVAAGDRMLAAGNYYGIGHLE